MHIDYNVVLLQIEDMRNEVKYSKYVQTGQYTFDIDLNEFIRRKSPSPHVMLHTDYLCSIWIFL